MWSRAVFVAGGQSPAEGPAAAPVSAPAGEGEEDREAVVTLQSIVKGWTQKITSERRWDSCDREPQQLALYAVLGQRVFNTNNKQPATTTRARPALPSSTTTFSPDGF